MSEEERTKKLEELCVKLGNSFVKEGEASGLPSTDGILALMNFAADATVQIAAQCDVPADFLGWAIQSFLKSLKCFADDSDVDIGLIMHLKNVDDESGPVDSDGGPVH